jgi:hypothetical protein
LPFTRIKYRTVAEDALNGMHIVRNRISHSGEEARAKYEKLTQAAPAFTEPSMYLLDQAAKSDRFSKYLGATRNIMEAVTTPNPNLSRLLGLPTSLDDKAIVISGEYSCTACGKHAPLQSGPAGVCQEAGCGDAGQRWQIVRPG